MTTLEALLGLDPASPEMDRAQMLADHDRHLLRELVKIRRARGLSQADVGVLMGVSQPTVAAFESHDANPKLSTIRRYAQAVGALVRHHVERDEGQLQNADIRANWLVVDIADSDERRRPCVGPAHPYLGAASFLSTSPANSKRANFALAA